MIAAWDALGNLYETSYNIDDQPLTTLMPATGQTGPGRGAATTTYLYPGGPAMGAALYDESGAQVRQVLSQYGAEGETLGQSGSTETASVVYDALYRLKTLRDGNNNATQYSYHPSGYLQSITYPGTDTVQFPLYDNAGNLLRRIDGRGVQTDYLYTDGDGLLTDVQYPATPALNVHVTYDNYGRPTQVTDGTGTHAYGYDDLDGTTSVTTTYTGLAAQTLTYTYHPDGSRLSLSTSAKN